MNESNELWKRCAAEAFGTFLLILLGCGAVHVAVLTGALAGLFQVAIVWGIAIMLAATVIGDVSGGHINPAITVALAIHKRFKWADVVPYISAQLVGAVLACLALFVMFDPWNRAFEQEIGIKRGEPGSEVSASVFCEFYPNPGASISKSTGKYDSAAHTALNEKLSMPAAMLAEFLGTMALGACVFATGARGNSVGKTSGLAPFFVGLTVCALICVFAPLTQACFNPARDFGPRLFAYFAGWGSAALPGPRGIGWLTVYIVAPIAGATAGGFIVRDFFGQKPE